MNQNERRKYIEDCERQIQDNREAYRRQTAQHDRALREHALEVQRIVVEAQLAVIRASCTATSRGATRDRITVAM